jgi:hypothetical protein
VRFWKWRYFPGYLALIGATACTGSVALVTDEEGEPSGSGSTPGSVGEGGSANGRAGSSSSSSGGSGTGKGSGGASTSSGGTSTGGTGAGSGDPPDEPVDCTDQGLHIGSDPLRRLSGTEYLNTLGDLFPALSPELPDLPTEAPVDSFDNDARALGPSDVYVSRWEEIAFRYTSAATATPEALAAFLPCAEDVSDAASGRACGAELIRDFGEQTQRRPPTTEESERYQALFDEKLAEIDFAAAVQLTAMAMLQSPWFLYRVEPDREPAADGTLPLDSWEVAARLSYFLWQRMPDAELLEQARSGELSDAAGIESAARRMLDDPRARAAVGDFHRQWLYFDRILKEEHATRVGDLFPEWTEDTQQAAYEELLRFTERTVFEGEGTLSSLFLSREAEIEPSLAGIYGVEVSGSGWSTVTLPADERAGLLTRVGFLAAHAHSANGSPPLRGSYVMQRLFCLKVDPPPPNADTTPPDPTGTALTNREQFEERTSPPDCAGCHAMLNSFGFGLEHYDAIGAYRDTDNGQPVNAVVELIDTDVNGEVDGAIELSESLASSQQVADCAVSRWFRYARGRGLEAEDACTLKQLNERFAANGGNLVELMVDIVTSPEFRHRAAVEN